VKKVKKKSRKPAARRAPVKTAPAHPAPKLGLQASVEKIVPLEWTIAHYDPRLPSVLSTPAMIGMMEIAAAHAVQPALAPGTITVGTRIEVDHLKAVSAGATVIATARLVQHKGRFLIFEVEARSVDHVIGRGKVHRAVVEPHSFHGKAKERAQQ
jgi:fluoroacetyl-CoA thioesterase